LPLLKSAAVPITLKDKSPNTSHSNYSALLDAIGDAKVVLIGEASHGTHDFYEQRAEITKLLITQKGFNMIATESDWPDAYRVNRFVQKGKTNVDSNPEDSLGNFRRFPLWMWRNKVVENFVQWLRDFNDGKFHNDDSYVMKAEDKVAFYGMDLYSFYSSMDAVVEYLEKVSPDDAKLAKKRYSNFDRFQGEPSAYGMHSGIGLSPPLEKEVVATLLDLHHNSEAYLKGVGGLIDGDELFYSKQNAELVKNAEEYYRKMYRANENTWNIRDSHMADCVEKLLQFHDMKHPDRTHKVVLWAHNSHLGDARATDAGRSRGEWNVGQLIREKFGKENTFNIGFSTYHGTVTAANRWDDPAYVFKVRHGKENSYEHVFHTIADSLEKSRDFFYLFRTNNPKVEINKSVVEIFTPMRLERYIGVIYRPDTEVASHYSKGCIAQEYDSVIFIDKTSALEPIDYTKTWEKTKFLLNE